MLTIAIHHIYETANYRELWPVLEAGDLKLEAPRQGNVVCVHAGDQRRTSQGNPAVERVDQSPIFLMEGTDTRIPRCKIIDDPAATVTGTVVNDDEFEIRESLAENALDGFGKETLAVIDRQKNAESRLAHLRMIQSSG